MPTTLGYIDIKFTEYVDTLDICGLLNVTFSGGPHPEMVQCFGGFLHRSYIHCVSKKTSPMILAITRESIVGFSKYLAEILLRKQAIKRCYIFPPHLINASALPCETENMEIESFHVNVSC